MRSRRFVRHAVAICGGLALITFGLAATPARAAAVLASGQITSAVTPTGTVGTPGKCLDEYGPAVNGATVDLWDCNGSGVQNWSMMDDGTIQINGKCLDIIGNSTANGTFVDLWDCNGLGGQQWVQQGNALVNPQSGRCLDDPGGWNFNGNRIRIWDCNGSPAQQWYPPTTVTNPGGDLVISVDDGGIDPNLMNQVISSTWPSSLGLPNGASVYAMDQATYSRDSGAPGAVRPPYMPDAYMYVSGSTVTFVVPAGDIPVSSNNLREWFAAALASGVAMLAAAIAWGLCTASFAAGAAAAQPVCWTFGTFTWSIIGSVVSHLLLPNVPWNWRNALAAAIVAGIGSGLLVWQSVWLIRVLGGKLYFIFRPVVNALRALYRWITNAPAVADNADVELGDVANNYPAEAANVAQQNGLAYPLATGPIYSGIPGKCVDNNGGFDYNGNTVQLWDCNGFGPAQNWTTWSNGNITTVNGRCLDIVGNNTANGTNVWTWECNGVGGQVWYQSGNAVWNPQSGRCLDDPGGWNFNGNVLRIWDCNNAQAQQWALP